MMIVATVGHETVDDLKVVVGILLVHPGGGRITDTMGWCEYRLDKQMTYSL